MQTAIAVALADGITRQRLLERFARGGFDPRIPAQGMQARKVAAQGADETGEVVSFDLIGSYE